MKRHSMKLLMLTAAFVALSSATARAGMIPNPVIVTPDSGNFRWTYGVVVTTDVKVNPGDSFTIYDFAGLVNGSITTPPDWVVTPSMTTTPYAGINPGDNPMIQNLTFTYVGTTAIPGQTGLGNFWALSTMGEVTTSFFTSSSHRQVDGVVENNITTTDTPAPPKQIGETPEPATIALFGLGLPILGLARWVRMRRKK